MQRDDFDLLTVGEAATQLSFGDGFFVQTEKPDTWWHFEVFGFKIYCYNFKWRQQALACHDLHHVVTGYPCTMRGEMQVATWEFAAGRFPNLFSNLFCLPLVALGVVVIPRKTFEAFERGKKSRSLFGRNIPIDVRSWPRPALVALTTKVQTPPSRGKNLIGFTMLSGLSFLEIAVLAIAIFGSVRALVGLL